MYHLVLRQFSFTLRNLDAIMAKAQQFATARKFDVNNFFSARLFPDMLPFAQQIRIACDQAKNAAALLAGKTPPKHEDNETTFEELRGRVAKCQAYLDSVVPSDYAAVTADTLIPLPNHKGKGMRAEDYLLSRQLPNFYFHVTTAYDLLRQGGVEIGKADFLGPINLRDLPL
jgi:hypothetical protein